MSQSTTKTDKQSGPELLPPARFVRYVLGLFPLFLLLSLRPFPGPFDCSGKVIGKRAGTDNEDSKESRKRPRYEGNEPIRNGEREKVQDREGYQKQHDRNYKTPDGKNTPNVILFHTVSPFIALVTLSTLCGLLCALSM